MSDPTPSVPEPTGGADDILGGLLGGLGGGFGDLFAQAQQAMSATQALADREVEGSSGGGVVRITATGAGEVRAIQLDPNVVDPDDIETLEDLIVAAFRDVQSQMAALHADAVGGFDPSAMLGGLFGGDVLDADAVDDDDEYEDD